MVDSNISSDLKVLWGCDFLNPRNVRYICNFLTYFFFLCLRMNYERQDQPVLHERIPVGKQDFRVCTEPYAYRTHEWSWKGIRELWHSWSPVLPLCVLHAWVVILQGRRCRNKGEGTTIGNWFSFFQVLVWLSARFHEFTHEHTLNYQYAQAIVWSQ